MKIADKVWCYLQVVNKLSKEFYYKRQNICIMVFTTNGFFEVARVGLEPATTEFHSDTLTDWAISYELYTVYSQ